MTTDKPTTSSERVRRFRQRKKKEYASRMEIYLSEDARRILKRLAAEWEKTPPAAIERLILDAGVRYRELIFPEAE
jgi:hypothetical protein